MTDYLCGAVLDGVAKKDQIPNLSGEVILCDSLRCSGQYGRTIHIDGEETKICNVDGRIPADDSPSSLPGRLKVSFI